MVPMLYLGMFCKHFRCFQTTVAQTHVRTGQRVWMATTRLLVGVLRDTLATPVA